LLGCLQTVVLKDPLPVPVPVASNYNVRLTLTDFFLRESQEPFIDYKQSTKIFHDHTFTLDLESDKTTLFREFLHSDSGTVFVSALVWESSHG
jgi:hypothetical protein